MTRLPFSVITLAELEKSDVMSLITKEILTLDLTDAGLSLVKAAGLKPGDPIWKLVELERARLTGQGVVEHEERVIAGIEHRLLSNGLRFGQFTRAVYKALGQPAPITAPNEPRPPRIKAKQEILPITLEEAQREMWLLGLGSPIELLEYPTETTLALRQQGVTHIWRCFEREQVFSEQLNNADMWRKIVKLGLPHYRPLAPELIEKLKRNDLFEAPPIEPIKPPPAIVEPVPSIQPSKPFVIPTEGELEKLLADLDVEADRFKQQIDKLRAARETLQAAKASLEMIEAGPESVEKMNSLIEEHREKLEQVEREGMRIVKLVIAIGKIKPLMPEFELVFTALNR